MVAAVSFTFSYFQARRRNVAQSVSGKTVDYSLSSAISTFVNAISICFQLGKSVRFPLAGGTDSKGLKLILCPARSRARISAFCSSFAVVQFLFTILTGFFHQKCGRLKARVIHLRL